MKSFAKTSETSRLGFSPFGVTPSYKSMYLLYQHPTNSVNEKVNYFVVSRLIVRNYEILRNPPCRL